MALLSSLRFPVASLVVGGAFMNFNKLILNYVPNWQTVLARADQTSRIVGQHLFLCLQHQKDATGILCKQISVRNY